MNLMNPTEFLSLILWFSIRLFFSLQYSTVQGINTTTVILPKTNRTTTPAVPLTTTNATKTIVRVQSNPISGIALRAFYVIIAVSALVIVYFLVRAICSRKRRQNTRRYGVLRTNQDRMEMHPLSEVEDDDDDDDLTLFDIKQEKRRNKR